MGRTLVLFLCLAPFLYADGWENLRLPELIPRCRLIAVGKLWTPGRAVDGWREGTLRISQTLYSAVGEVDRYEVRVAAETVPGETQHWAGGTTGIWFVLRDGDAYEPLNHPSCWMDAERAEEVCNQAYATFQELYEEALAAVQAAEEGSGGSGDGTDESDTSDDEDSVEAYAAAAEAADAARSVAYQDEDAQVDAYYEQVRSLLEAAGTDFQLPAAIEDAVGQASALLGVEQALLEKVLRGDPQGVRGLKDSLSRVLNQLVRNTLGAADPRSALERMGSIPLDLPAPGGARPPGPPGPAAGKPSFSLPRAKLQDLGGSRRGMFNGLTRPGGGRRPGPGRPGPGPR